MVYSGFPRKAAFIILNKIICYFEIQPPLLFGCSSKQAIIVKVYIFQ